MADKSIRVTSATIDAMAVDWAMIDALMVGTSAMREGGKSWLPKWPKESKEAYEERLNTAVLHPVFKRTVLVNASRPFSRPVTIGDGTPKQVVEWMRDIDLQGTAFGAFALQIMTAVLSKGLHGVLVDYPKVPDVRTKADEKAVGARPYWVHYPANSILGWRTEKASAKGLKLTQLRLLEMVEVPDGEYGTKMVEQVRVLTPGAWAVYQQNKEKPDIWDEIESGPTTLDYVPFKFFYGTRKGFGIGNSPLLDLAYQNIEHWQSASDQQTILHVARVPILFVKCLGDVKLTVGAGSALQSDDKDGDAKYVEHSGKAIDAGAKSIQQLEDRMRATGAELISLDAGFATATEVSSDSEASKSLLQQVCENFEESAQQCMVYMTDFVKETAEPSVELYKDFGVAASGDPAVLSSASGVGTISKQTHFEELQRRDVVDPNRTWEDEQLRLSSDAVTAAKNAAALAAAQGTPPAP